MNNKQIINVATDLGYMLLKSGAEVYRVEESARLICQSYGVKKVDVFAIPTSVVLTISDGDDFVTKTRRVLSNDIDLEKVDKLNNLSRYICENLPSYDEIKVLMAEIDEIKAYDNWVRIFCFGAIAMSFTLLFGSNYYEGGVSFFIGTMVALTQIFMEKGGATSFLKTTTCSFVISLIACGAMELTGGLVNFQAMVSGSLMILVPGLALTNCMRDFMANDYMSGVAKFAEAIMTALASAMGVAVVLLTIM